MNFDQAMGRIAEGVAKHLSSEGLFRPALGESLACAVRLDAAEAFVAFGEVKAVAADALILVDVAALPRRPTKGDQFTITTRDSAGAVQSVRVFDVIEPAARQQPLGLEWAVRVIERAR